MSLLGVRWQQPCLMGVNADRSDSAKANLHTNTYTQKKKKKGWWWGGDSAQLFTPDSSATLEHPQFHVLGAVFHLFIYLHK